MGSSAGLGQICGPEEGTHNELAPTLFGGTVSAKIRQVESLGPPGGFSGEVVSFNAAGLIEPWQAMRPGPDTGRYKYFNRRFPHSLS